MVNLLVVHSSLLKILLSLGMLIECFGKLPLESDRFSNVIAPVVGSIVNGPVEHTKQSRSVYVTSTFVPFGAHITTFSQREISKPLLV